MDGLTKFRIELVGQGFLGIHYVYNVMFIGMQYVYNVRFISMQYVYNVRFIGHNYNMYIVSVN